MKPRIGITPSPTLDTLPNGTFRRYAMAAPYVDAVLAAGGVPIILPPQDDHADTLLDAVDGLLLSGGGDIEPWRFGAPTVHPATYGLSPERDRFEIELVGAALRRDLPLLGICRGIQVINVALGGTLIQDIATEHASPTRVVHRQGELGIQAEHPSHPVRIERRSPLTDAAVGGTMAVNSFHHQAIATPAPDLAVVAVSPDDLIEAVMLPEGPFLLAVQWHPELMFSTYPEHLRPFSALVQAAANRLVLNAA